MRKRALDIARFAHDHRTSTAQQLNDTEWVLNSYSGIGGTPAGHWELYQYSNRKSDAGKRRHPASGSFMRVSTVQHTAVGRTGKPPTGNEKDPNTVVGCTKKKKDERKTLREMSETRALSNDVLRQTCRGSRIWMPPNHSSSLLHLRWTWTQQQQQSFLWKPKPSRRNEIASNSSDIEDPEAVSRRPLKLVFDGCSGRTMPKGLEEGSRLSRLYYEFLPRVHAVAAQECTAINSICTTGRGYYAKLFCSGSFPRLPEGNLSRLGTAVRPHQHQPRSTTQIAVASGFRGIVNTADHDRSLK
ncbi:hypothetical protein C8R45DRAFT_1075161 [Mycena sanguinolenta]|nr:hypothetical protein C8R45DRAFT_1075161 [Mycena sanguinolenta]